MGTLEREATEEGRLRGWDHANYAENCGGVLPAEDTEVPVPAEFLQVATYYTAGFMEGVGQYREDDREDDEFEDPREAEWQGLAD